jgi:hypothetical protein
MGWKPGQSGNPGGRPRARFDLQALARERTPEAIATLVRIMRQKSNLTASTRATEILLAYGWGRPESASAVFNVMAAEGGRPVSEIVVSFVPGREPEDGRPIGDLRLLTDLRSPHLPNGRRSN